MELLYQSIFHGMVMHEWLAVVINAWTSSREAFSTGEGKFSEDHVLYVGSISRYDLNHGWPHGKRTQSSKQLQYVLPSFRDSQPLGFHCPFTTSIWSVFINLFSMAGLCPNGLQKLSVCGLQGREALSKGGGEILWKILPFTICWDIWKEWNARIFKCQSSDLEKIEGSNIFRHLIMYFSFEGIQRDGIVDVCNWRRMGVQSTRVF